MPVRLYDKAGRLKEARDERSAVASADVVKCEGDVSMSPRLPLYGSNSLLDHP